MKTSQPSFVVFSFIRIISFDVTNVMTRQFVDGLFDLSKPSSLSHGKGGEVSVCAGAVPVTLNHIYFLIRVVILVIEMNIGTEKFLFFVL